MEIYFQASGAPGGVRPRLDSRRRNKGWCRADSSCTCISIRFAETMIWESGSRVCESVCV